MGDCPPGELNFDGKKYKVSKVDNKVSVEVIGPSDIVQSEVPADSSVVKTVDTTLQTPGAITSEVKPALEINDANIKTDEALKQEGLTEEEKKTSLTTNPNQNQGGRRRTQKNQQKNQQQEGGKRRAKKGKIHEKNEQKRAHQDGKGITKINSIIPFFRLRK